MLSTRALRTRSLRTRSLTSALLAVVVTAVALALTGCGGSTPATTFDPIAQAAEATTHAGGARMTLHAQVTAPGSGIKISMTGSGIFNMAREEGQLSFEVDHVTGAPAGALEQLGSGKLQFTELFGSGKLYMRSPLFDGHLPGGAKWIKLDLNKVRQAEGIDAQSLSNTQSDPTQFLRLLKADGGSVTNDGKATVGGVPTTHYTGNIDLEKAAETLPTQNRAKLKSSLENLVAKLGTGKIPVQVWIDEHHLVRRMHVEMPFRAGGKQVTTAIDYTLSEFGVQPGVNLPSDSEAFDATQLGLSQLNAG